MVSICVGLFTSTVLNRLVVIPIDIVISDYANASNGVYKKNQESLQSSEKVRAALQDNAEELSEIVSPRKIVDRHDREEQSVQPLLEQSDLNKIAIKRTSTEKLN